MKYQATVLRIDEDIEEQVLVNVAGIELTCFVGVCPLPIEVGCSYEVTLSLFWIDGPNAKAVDDEHARMDRIGDGFRYRIVGALNGAQLDSGIIFEDDLFVRQYGHLSARTITLEANRIDIAFAR